MKGAVSEQVASQVLSRVEKFINVDGYYTRRDEVHIRGMETDAPPDWQARLAAELGELQLRAKIDRGGDAVYLTVFPRASRFPWINVALFAATLVSVSFSYTYIPLFTEGFGAAFRAATDGRQFLHWQGFTLPLLGILLVHEFGHYWAARRRGIRVSLPFFLPAPTFIGTFGAFIKSNSPFQSRRDLLEVGAYGPMAGFVVAVIFLAIGLTTVVHRAAPEEMTLGGLVEPLIMKILQPIFMAETLPEHHVIYLQDNPVLFAAWVGLFVTALNLLPVGQLDGGHIVYALSPRLHFFVSRAVFGLLALFGLFWPGWFFWAILVFFVIRFRHPPTLNDFQPLAKGSRRLGWAAMLIFVLTFSPAPF